MSNQHTQKITPAVLEIIEGHLQEGCIIEKETEDKYGPAMAGFESGIQFGLTNPELLKAQGLVHESEVKVMGGTQWVTVIELPDNWILLNWRIKESKLSVQVYGMNLDGKVTCDRLNFDEYLHLPISKLEYCEEVPSSQRAYTESEVKGYLDASNDLQLQLVEMSERIKGDAIEFAEWLDNNYWQKISGKNCHEWINHTKCDDPTQQTKTTTELYKLFKDGK